MATAIDIIHLALKVSGVIGVGQTPDAEDTSDAFVLLNSLLTEWQMQRWLVPDLVDVAFTATGQTSYSVGETGDFVTASATRPDKVDSAYARVAGVDTQLWPFISREGFDRMAAKATPGIPESYFYDAQLAAVGTIFFYPTPANLSCELHINCKAPLGQYVSLTDEINLPASHIAALRWNLAADLRPLYQLPEDPQLSQRASRSLSALVTSITQMPQAVQPKPTFRSGVYSQFAPQANPQQSQ